MYSDPAGIGKKLRSDGPAGSWESGLWMVNWSALRTAEVCNGRALAWVQEGEPSRGVFVRQGVELYPSHP